MNWFQSLPPRQKQGIAAVGGIIVIVVVIVLIVVLSGGGGNGNSQATGTPGLTPGTPAQATEGPTPNETDIANGTPARTALPTQAPNGEQPTSVALPTSPPSGPTMKLTIESGGSCDGDQCHVPASGTFTLGVEAVRVPAAGYVLMQTYIDYGGYDPSASEDGAGPGTCSDGVDNAPDGQADEADRRDSDCQAQNALVYMPTDNASDEVVWADAASDVTVRQQLGPGLLLHGALTGIEPPLPTSNATGLMVKVQMTCPSTPGTFPIQLLPYGEPDLAPTSGSLFVLPPGEQKVAPYTESITVHCE